MYRTENLHASERTQQAPEKEKGREAAPGVIRLGLFDCA